MKVISAKVDDETFAFLTSIAPALGFPNMNSFLKHIVSSYLIRLESIPYTLARENESIPTILEKKETP